MKQSTDEFRKFAQDFQHESDRAIVVLTVARIDYLLKEILQKHLIPNSSRKDDFFESQGPGSTLSNKITLAYRLGLIDADFTKKLHLARRLRNDFAHQPTECSLDKGGHRDQVRALIGDVAKLDIARAFRHRLLENVPESRAGYMTILGIIIVRLESLLESIATIDQAPALVLLTEAARNYKLPDENNDEPESITIEPGE